MEELVILKNKQALCDSLQVAKVFENKKFGAIRTSLTDFKGTYYGYCYVLDLSTEVKIGSTKSPHARLMSLIRTLSKYGDKKINRIAFTQKHTNYKENEKYLHELNNKFRNKGTELF